MWVNGFLFYRTHLLKLVANNSFFKFVKFQNNRLPFIKGNLESRAHKFGDSEFN